MNTGYIRKSSAAKCIVHRMVKECCIEELHNKGYFRKEKILKDLGIASDEGLRWDYLREFIEDETKVELVGVAERFFQRQKECDYDDEGNPITVQTHPNRYIAGGSGRRTVGYASVVLYDGSFAVARIKTRVATTKTMRNKNKKDARALRQAGKLSKEDSHNLLN